MQMQSSAWSEKHVTGIDLDRCLSQPPHKEQSVLTTGGRHRDSSSLTQRNEGPPHCDRSSRSLCQVCRVPSITELVKISRRHVDGSNPRLVEVHIVESSTPQQTIPARQPDGTDPHLTRSIKHEEQVGLTTQLPDSRDRTILVCLAFHEGVQGPLLRELGGVRVVLTSNRRNDRIIEILLSGTFRNESTLLSSLGTVFNHLHRNYLLFKKGVRQRQRGSLLYPFLILIFSYFLSSFSTGIILITIDKTFESAIF